VTEEEICFLIRPGCTGMQYIGRNMKTVRMCKNVFLTRRLSRVEIVKKFSLRATVQYTLRARTHENNV
jgi:hypothetical protein